MIKSRYLFFIILNFLLWSFYFVLKFSPDLPRITFPEFNNRDIRAVEINGKPLAGKFIESLTSLNNLRLISRKKDYHSLFGLEENKGDLITLFFNNNETINFYAGSRNSDNHSIYIRLENNNDVFEAGSELVDIINEKPDLNREFSIIEPNPLSSYIAIEIEMDFQKLYITEDSENEWIDQISGISLSSLKVQNLINKITNLRAPLSDVPAENYKQNIRIQLERLNGQVYSMEIGYVDKNYMYIKNNSNSLFIIESNMLDFLNLTIEDLQ